MKKLFIHQPLFRLLSPVLSGVIIYLLILLLNNNLAQIQEDFFNQELYFCIALSYFIQELSRLLLVLFKNTFVNKLSFWFLFLQVIISLISCIVFATIAIHLYFNYILGFSVTTEEVYVFNSIFCSINFIYVLLYVSNQYLHKINTKKLAHEELIKQNIKDDFKQFKRGINPNLLFKSFENLLILIKHNKEKTDDFIDHLATIYRYILSNKQKQLVTISDEIDTINEFFKLLNFAPNIVIHLKNNCNSTFLVVPNSLLFIVEKIVNTTIISDKLKLVITIADYDNNLIISYDKFDKITSQFNLNCLQEIIRSYSVYSLQSISVIEENEQRKIILPQLKMDSKI